MNTRKTVRKWFWVWEFEKEEQWLNTMAQSGWVLDGVGFCTYHFIACEPGEYTVRLEMHDRDDNYVSFMEECGAEYVGRIVRWMFFRKKTADGTFDIFSDIDSRIAHIKKIGKMLTGVGFANLLIGLFNPMGWINLLCATVLMYGAGRVHGKQEALEQKRSLVE